MGGELKPKKIYLMPEAQKRLGIEFIYVYDIDLCVKHYKDKTIKVDTDPGCAYGVVFILQPEDIKKILPPGSRPPR